MKIMRVFPRKTSATPTDELAIVNRAPVASDECDEVHISVTFTWDIPLAESLYIDWSWVAPTKIGGPAFKDPGEDFVPGKYVKEGYVITSRGCPNNCWFCSAWKNEGRQVRELPIHEGWNLLDNNILACSEEHQIKVFEMLSRQPQKPRFTGGLEAARLRRWHAEWFKKLKPTSAYFAYDTPDDYAPLIRAADILKNAGILKNHTYGCYVLIGHDGDTFPAAEYRLISVIKMGFFPQAMLYNRGVDMPLSEMKAWRRFQRLWANKILVGLKMKQYR